LQRTADTGNWTLDTREGTEGSENVGPKRSPFQIASQDAQLEIYHCSPPSSHLCYFCCGSSSAATISNSIPSCSLYKARSHTIPQSQWGRHETPLLEGTLSVQRHHYFTPAKLKAQSSHGAAQMEMEVQIEEQGQEQERIGRGNGERVVCGSGKRAHKNGINIMAKLRTSCRSRTQKQGLEMVNIRYFMRTYNDFFLKEKL